MTDQQQTPRHVIGWTPEVEIEQLKAANLRAWQAHGEKADRLGQTEAGLSAWRAWAIIGWFIALLFAARLVFG